MTSSPNSASPPPGEPSPELRTIVSLLVFVHLFAFGLAVLTNSDSGVSELLRDVRERTPGLDPYLTQLWINRPYDYHLMNDLPLDYDHRLEAAIHYPDGRPDELVTLPPAGVWPSERRQRYQQIAWHVNRFKILAEGQGATEDNEQRKVLISGAIGAGLLRQHPEATSVAVKCIFHRGIRRDQLASSDKKESNPEDPQYYETVSNVTVLLVGGRPEVFENLPLPEVAPVHKAGSSATTPAPQSKGK